MITKNINVTARINNLPIDGYHGYIVARLGECAELWYYGTYETRQRALEVATFLENAVVLENIG